jgi:hypothetical protein
MRLGFTALPGFKSPSLRSSRPLSLDTSGRGAGCVAGPKVAVGLIPGPTTPDPSARWRPSSGGWPHGCSARLSSPWCGRAPAARPQPLRGLPLTMLPQQLQERGRALKGELALSLPLPGNDAAADTVPAFGRGAYAIRRAGTLVADHSQGFGACEKDGAKQEPADPGRRGRLPGAHSKQPDGGPRGCPPGPFDPAGAVVPGVSLAVTEEARHGLVT